MSKVLKAKGHRIHRMHEGVAFERNKHISSILVREKKENMGTDDDGW